MAATVLSVPACASSWVVNAPQLAYSLRSTADMTPVTAYSPLYTHDNFEFYSPEIYIYPSTETYVAIWGTEPSAYAHDIGDLWAQAITQDWFRTNIVKYLPAEFWARDDDPTGGNQALYYFTQTVALTMDELKQAVDEFTNLIDVDTCPSNYLRAIADFLNYPLEERDTLAEQRHQLKHAIYWYRKKGAIPAFEAILYAFGFDATIIPLWTTKDDTTYGTYSEFFETPIGVSRGILPPNDWSGLVENGGVWFQSPHFGVRLNFIVGDNYGHAEYVNIDPTEDLLDNYDFEEDLTSWTTNVGDGSIDIELYDIAEGSKALKLTNGTLQNTTAEQEFTCTPGVTYDISIKAHGDGISSGAIEVYDVTGSTQIGVEIVLDSGTDYRALDFSVEAPEDCVTMRILLRCPAASGSVGYFDSVHVTVNPAFAAIRYYFDQDDFRYMWRRTEHIRPVFAVLSWFDFLLNMYDAYTITEVQEFATADAYSNEMGWFSGYCTENDPVYTRLDERLLGPYTYTSDTPPAGIAPPYRRTGTWPLGSVIINHKRWQESAACNPPENLEVQVDFVHTDPYQLALTKNGMGLYSPTGTGSYTGHIDKADFPSRGFTDAGSDPGHANVPTREFGYVSWALSHVHVSTYDRVSAIAISSLMVPLVHHKPVPDAIDSSMTVSELFRLLPVINLPVLTAENLATALSGGR